MKKYKLQIILVVAAVAMSSCNGDIYDNIKEYVDSEIVYPAGYDEADVVLKAGFERIEIYLMKDIDKEPNLTKAKKTVVEYGDTSLIFTPARSWVNITGLTNPQTYNFKIFTEDEFGNRSAPVTIKGKPFTDADKNSLVFGSFSVSASASRAIIRSTQSPDVYDICSAEYTFHDGSSVRSGTFDGKMLLIDNLPAGHLFKVSYNFHLLPIGALDTIPVPAEAEFTTMSQTDFDAYMNETSPFPKNPYNITKDAEFYVCQADFDLGDFGVAAYRNPGQSFTGNMEYRRDNGDQNERPYGVVFGNGYEAAWCDNTTAGDWYVYSVNVVDPGVYKIETRMNYGFAYGAYATLTIDNLDVFGNIYMPVTGWGNWRWLDIASATYLTAGKHKLKYSHVIQPHCFGGLRFTFVEY